MPTEPARNASTITTGAARCAAKDWVRAEVAKFPELVGVVVAGSAGRRAPAEPHPRSSDVDLFIYVDAHIPSDIHEPRGRFAPRKLLFRGVVLEPSFHNARELADVEALLGDFHLAPLFTNPCILLDPGGRLGAVAAAVTPEFRRRRHARRRLEQALQIATPDDPPFLVPDSPAIRAPCWRKIAFAFGVMRFPLAVVAAALRYPTVRRSFVVAREVLGGAGREDFADELLRLLGSFELGREEVGDLAAEAEHTYDIAVATRRTPVPLEWNVSPDARELERAAVREMIDAGQHREALLQLLLLRTAAQGIIENDGTEPVREASRRGYRRLLSALGIDGDEALEARGRALRAFLPTLRGTCEELLAGAPGLLD